MPSVGPKATAKWLRDRREVLRLSRQQVVRKSGDAISYSTLVKVEQGLQAPTAPFLRGIAPALNTPVDYLLRMAGFLPSTAEVGEPRAPEPVTFAQALRTDGAGDPAFSAEEKRELANYADYLKRKRRT